MDYRKIKIGKVYNKHNMNELIEPSAKYEMETWASLVADNADYSSSDIGRGDEVWDNDLGAWVNKTIN